MNIDATMKEVLQYADMNVGLDDVKRTPHLLREGMRKSLEQMPNGESVDRVEDHTLALKGRNIPIRMYRQASEEPLPAIIFYHGGGFVIGDIYTHDSVCRSIANRVKAAVISVDYRLAPEHPFPAAVNDAYDSFVWISEHANELGIIKEKIAVAGDSAGGNLAAVTTVKSIESSEPSVYFQLLIYPSVGNEENRPASHRDNEKGPVLTPELMKWFFRQYITPETDPRNPDVSPLFSPLLAKLPKTHIVTAKYDPLLDSGKDYARKLQELGVDVSYKMEEDMPHGFVNFHQVVPRAQESLDEMCAELRKSLT
ncbi:acetyl esterase [Geomicrobium halophilum]|uniref:Acetyl esterase n=1 Tax=Geomicrobium halophilum TaxID=549000 RepID=A0A841PMT0_9BACL|nr:alpha/beta hydrolase [Geomicrobium halophilum]MBB6448526.1 acetyl esterase [Geomicrobium halophilum]